MKRYASLSMMALFLMAGAAFAGGGAAQGVQDDEHPQCAGVHAPRALQSPELLGGAEHGLPGRGDHAL